MDFKIKIKQIQTQIQKAQMIVFFEFAIVFKLVFFIFLHFFKKL